MKKLSNGILKRIFVLTISGILIVNLYVWFELKSQLESFLVEKGKTIENISEKTYKNFLIQNPKINNQEIVEKISLLISTPLSILDKEGNILASSQHRKEETNSNYINLPEIKNAMEKGMGYDLRFSPEINNDVFYFSVTRKEKGRIIGFFYYEISAFEYYNKLTYARIIMFVVDFWLMILMLIIYFIVKGYIKKHTNKLITTLEDSDLGNQISHVAYQNIEELNQIAFHHNQLINKVNSQFEEASKRQKQLLDLLNSLSEGIAAFDKKEILIFSNKNFERILNIKSRVKEKNSIFEFVDFPPIIKAISNFLENKTEYSSREKYYDNKFIEYTIVPLTQEEKESGFILIVRDITVLENLEKVRTDFVANVSHEFKTPLTSIRGYTETLLEGVTDKKYQEKFLGKIHKQTLYLESMVSDLLKLSRIEKKNVHNISDILLKPIINEISEEFRTKIEDTGHKYEFYFHVRDDLKIKANKNLISTIATNFLSNAVQYSKEKGVIVLSIYEIENRVFIEVKDNGIGISEDEIDRIFERFYRTKEAKDIFSTGSGLGLSIVKNSVELLGGKFGVESKLGEGSKFWVNFEIVG